MESILPKNFRSLRVRMLLPLLAVAFLASVAVAVVSYLLGDRWAQEDLLKRYEGINQTLSQAAFPLTQPVIDTLASLTDTELVALGEEGRVIASSLPSFDASDVASLSVPGPPMQQVVLVDGRAYRCGIIDRKLLSSDRTRQVAVLVDDRMLRSTRMRAASLPLLTGLSTIILLTSVTWLVASRLIRRLSRLQLQVNKTASGDFETHIPIGASDEVGMLAGAVQRMNDQLKSMWTTLQRQQGQKLLHQLAGGLAHQLRNSITGARMAVELHRKQCEDQDDSLEVAISQLEQTESHMQRLLVVASGKQEGNKPQSLGATLAEAERVLSSTARHLRVVLHWQIEEDLDALMVADGPSLHAAVTNLVLNAMQAGTEVWVTAEVGPELVQITVEDNGTGPPESVAEEIFEPFVTSKPEGLGLGLPLVAESAKRLGGDVSWRRENGRTRFSFTARVTAAPAGSGEG